MAEPPKNYIVRNCLLFAFKALRNTERHIDGSLASPYEEFFTTVANALSPLKKLNFAISNSEVESFYNRRFSENEFMVAVQSRILSKIPTTGTNAASTPTASNGAPSTPVGTFNQYSLLFSVVWDNLSTQNAGVCKKLPKLSGKQLWEVFLKLDTGCELKVHVDDLVDLILRIFQANGHKEQHDSIKEWFCGEEKIDFWSFFSQLTEKYVGLLEVQVVQEIHTKVVSELLKEGKLEKKGHVVHNWKTRWFVLTASSLSYFESQDNLILKGCVMINRNALVQNMQEFRARPHRFRVVCGETKNATEISAPSQQSMQDWVYTIRMAIKMHHTDGRNFLHKFRLASASIPKLIHSASEDRKLVSKLAQFASEDGKPSPQHKGLASSRSVPLDSNPQPPVSLRNKPLTTNVEEDSGEFRDAPLLPPQRFNPSDVESMTGNPQVFDKEAFVEARRNSSRMKNRRHSSLEPGDVEHIESGMGIYALVNKSPVKKKEKNRDVTSLLSSTVRAQLPPEATEQITNWDNEVKDTEEKNKEEEKDEEEKKSRRNPGYVQLDFHMENGFPRGRIADEKQPADTGKTKYGYSTVVFEKESPASRPRPKKMPPLPPPKYEGQMPKHSSDSKLLYSDVCFGTAPLTPQQSKSAGGSASDLTHSGATGEESPYVNVRHGGAPVVPPRRGVASPMLDQNPLVPDRKS